MQPKREYRNPFTVIAAMVAALCVGFLTHTSYASDWPNFRGPAHDGISPEKGFKKSWDGPVPVVWEMDIGAAYSSMAIAKNKLYTCGTRPAKEGGGAMQTLICINILTQKIEWETPIEKEYKDSMGDGARATPTVNDGRVYVLGAHGRLLCADAESGKEIWSATFSHKPQWGYSASVLVDGDLAISSGGGPDGALVAFDKATGAVKWKTGSDPAGYATPYPFTFEGTHYIVGFTADSALIVDAKDGRQVLRMGWKTDWGVNAAAPIFHDGYLFLSSGYKTGCGLFKLSKDGDNLKADNVWTNQVFLTKFQSCVLHEGHLYVSDQRWLVCADFKTGEEKWRAARDKAEQSIKDSPLLIADGSIILLNQNGALEIAPASPKAYEPTAHVNVLTGRCWSLPVLFGGRLYARNLDRLVCLDLTDRPRIEKSDAQGAQGGR